MNQYYSEADFLPAIPEELILDLETIEAEINICPTANIKPNNESIFRVYDASQELYDLITPHLDFEAAIRWQIVTADLPIHYDWGESGEKYLYTIEQGGDNVVTEFYSEKDGDPVTGGSFEQGDRELMFDFVAPLREWVQINVKKPHRVVNITEPRIALIIRRL